MLPKMSCSLELINLNIVATLEFDISKNVSCPESLHVSVQFEEMYSMLKHPPLSHTHTQITDKSRKNFSLPFLTYQNSLWVYD